jgi:hypothetical protein
LAVGPSLGLYAFERVVLNPMGLGTRGPTCLDLRREDRSLLRSEKLLEPAQSARFLLEDYTLEWHRSLSPSRWTPVFASLLAVGFAILLLTPSPLLSKEQIVFARMYRTYDLIKNKRYGDAVKELEKASETLRYFPGPKSPWEIVDKQLKPLLTRIGDCILDRLLPVVAGQDAAALDAMLPKVLETAASLAHPSDRLRRAGDALESLGKRERYKTPRALERLTSRWEPFRLVWRTTVVFTASLAISIGTFGLLAYAFSKPLFDYDNMIRIAYGFLTCFIGLTAALILRRR